MVVVETASACATGGPPWVALSGTIQEVIDELQNQNVTKSNIVYYEDDKTNAKACFCRTK